MVAEEVIASVGFNAFEKLEFCLLVSLKSRSSHFSIEIQDLLTVGHPCVLRPLRCGKMYWLWCFWFLDAFLSSLSFSSSESDGMLALSSSPASLTLRLDFLRSLRKVRLFLAIFAVVSGLTLLWFRGVTSFSSSDMISIDGVRDLRLVLPAIPSPSLSFADFVA